MQHGGGAGGSRTRKHGLHPGQVPGGSLAGWQRVDARDLEACIEMGIVSWIDLNLDFIESCRLTVVACSVLMFLFCGDGAPRRERGGPRASLGGLAGQNVQGMRKNHGIASVLTSMALETCGDGTLS